jgi:hypothetical protein
MLTAADAIGGHAWICKSQKPQPLELRFRALLTEGSTEQVELARA